MSKTIVVASLVAVLAGSSLVAIAQAPQQPPQQPGGEPRRERLTDADRSALIDARIAGLKAGLKLTPEQEKLWPGVEAALRDMAKTRAERFAKMREERREARGQVDPLQRLRRGADMMTQRGTDLRQLADAVEPLYKTLDEAQKRRLSVMMAAGMRDRAMAWRDMAWRRAADQADDRRPQ
jgi:zinc resistance-associated protein